MILRKETDDVIFTTTQWQLTNSNGDQGLSAWANWLEKNGWAACVYPWPPAPDVVIVPSRHLQKPIHVLVHELVERDVLWTLHDMGFKPDEKGLMGAIQNTVVTHIMSKYKDARWGRWSKGIKSGINKVDQP